MKKEPIATLFAKLSTISKMLEEICSLICSVILTYFNNKIAYIIPKISNVFEDCYKTKNIVLFHFSMKSGYNKVYTLNIS